MFTKLIVEKGRLFKSQTSELKTETHIQLINQKVAAL